MENFKKVLRLAGLVLLIILASLGIGITGHFLPNNREKYRDSSVQIELIDKKHEEDSEEDSEQPR